MRRRSPSSFLPSTSRADFNCICLSYLILGCCLSSAMADLVESPSTRVMGVGIGIFLLGFFGCISVLVCCFGAATPTPGRFYMMGSLGFGLLILYLFAAKKQPQFIVQDAVVEDYNENYYIRIGIGLILMIGACCGLRGVVNHKVFPPVETTFFDEEVKTRREFF